MSRFFARAAALLILLMLVVCGFCVLLARAVPGGIIVFTSNHEGSSHIYVLDAESRHIFNLTRRGVTAGARHVRPSWSPDSRRLAFLSDRGVGDFQLYTMRSDGSHVQQQTFPPGFVDAFAWSPDGVTVVYTKNVAGGQRLYRLTLAETPRQAEAGDMTMTFNGEEIFLPQNYGYFTISPAWSPDGRELAFYAVGSGQPGVYRAAVDSLSDGIRLVEGTTGFTSDLAWSPDGRWIAFTQDTEGRGDLFRVSMTEPAAAERLTSDPAYEVSPAWLPDSRRLLFARGGDLYLLDLPTGTIASLLALPGTQGDPEWRP